MKYISLNILFKCQNILQNVFQRSTKYISNLCIGIIQYIDWNFYYIGQYISIILDNINIFRLTNIKNGLK